MMPGDKEKAHVTGSRSNAELLALSAEVLLIEVLNQSWDVVATGDVRDLTEALSFLAPLTAPKPD